MEKTPAQKFSFKTAPQMKKKFILSSYMKDAVHILTLPVLELNRFIEQEIEINPLLEKTEKSKNEYLLAEEDKKTTDPDISECPYHFQENKKINTYEKKNGSFLENKKDSFIENIISPPSIYDCLLFQVSIAFKIPEDKLVATHLIGSLNSQGFLDSPLEEIAKELNISEKKLRNILKIIQSFDPPGIGATSLSESLLIQLERQGKKNLSIYHIIKNYFQDLLDKNFSKISKKTKISLSKIQTLSKNELKKLNFSPLQTLIPNNPQPITPDIVVKQEENKWIIMVNEQNLPKFYIQDKYNNEMASFSPSERDYIKKYISRGVWLKKAIESRRIKLIKVMQLIIKMQKNFLLGEGSLFPMTYKDLSSFLKCHVSTISRIVANKYISCPLGLLPMRSFFSSPLKCNSQKKSSAAALQILKKLVQEEDKKKPLSDGQLTQKLCNLGFSLARRTVTKYRKKLHISSSNLRQKTI